MMAMKLRFGLSLAACGLPMLLLVSPAHANTLTPGESGSPDTFTLSGLTLLASSPSEAQSDGSLTWDFAEAVYSDPSNTFGAGDLDFMYQVTNTTNPDVDVFLSTINFQDFTGFSTDVGVTSSGSTLPGGVFVNGNNEASDVDRSDDGSQVGFEYFRYSSDTSYVMVIETNATNYDANGLMNLSFEDIDPSSSAFEPAAATGVPEPGTTALLGAGLLLIGVLRRRLT